MSTSKEKFWIALLLAMFLLSACSRYENDDLGIFIIDDAKMLTKQTRSWLASYKYPKGYAFTIRTQKSIPEHSIGVAADDLFEATLDQHPLKDAFSRRGVLLVVSESPRLIQVRVGHEIYSQARWGGVAAGQRYVEKQQAALQMNLNLATRKMVAWVASDLPRVTELPWYKQWLLQSLLQTLHLELDSLSLPSDGFYGTYLLKPIVTVRIAEHGLFGSWWMTYCLVAISLYLTKLLLGLILINPLKKLFSPSVGSTVAIAISIGLGILLAIPAAASAVILSGSRLEDQIALKALGLTGIDRFVFQPELFNESTGIWVAILIVVLRTLKGIADRGSFAGLAFLPGDQQRNIFEHLKKNNPVGAFFIEACGTRAGQLISISEKDFLMDPFSYAYVMPLVDDVSAGIKWGLLALVFLPLPFALSAVYFWVVPIAAGLFVTLRSLKANQWGHARNIHGQDERSGT